MAGYFERLSALFRYEDLLLIGIAIIIGLAVGAEREYKSKSAGLRTLMLVCVGSCTFTILSLKIGVANPDRLAANIITGIGFLGAGAIFRDDNKVSGITTACTIWVTAALGMCVGSGHIYLGMLSAAVVLFVLLSLVRLERWIDKTNKVKVYKITTEYSEHIIGDFEKQFAGFQLDAYRILELKSNEKLTTHWKVRGHQQNHDLMKTSLFSNPAVSWVEL